MEFPYLHESKIEAAAQALLGRAFDGQAAVGPCVDLDALVFDFLVERERMYFSNERDLGHDDGDKILGRMVPLAGRVEVCRTVLVEGPEGRYRFTVAHELGHWVMHRPLFLAESNSLSLFGDQPVTGPMISLNRNVFPHGHRPPPEEWQANRFAVALLVDPDLLRVGFEARFHEAPFVCSPGDLRVVSRDVACEEAQGRPPLKDEFGLSMEAMAIALESRGYVTDRRPMI